MNVGITVCTDSRSWENDVEVHFNLSGPCPDKSTNVQPNEGTVSVRESSDTVINDPITGSFSQYSRTGNHAITSSMFGSS